MKVNRIVEIINKHKYMICRSLDWIVSSKEAILIAICEDKDGYICTMPFNNIRFIDGDARKILENYFDTCLD